MMRLIPLYAMAAVMVLARLGAEVPGAAAQEGAAGTAGASATAEVRAAGGGEEAAKESEAKQGEGVGGEEPGGAAATGAESSGGAGTGQAAPAGPSGTGGVAGQAGGAGGEAAVPEDKVRLSAEQARMEPDGAMRAAGNVRVEGSDLQATAREVLIDADQVWITFRGEVVVGTKETHTTASRVEVNLDTEKWRVYEGRTEVLPAFFSEGVFEPIYVRGKVIRTPDDRDVIEAVEAAVTSCNKAHPHYELRSRYIEARPKRVVKVRRPSLYLFGTRVFKFPFDLTFRLDGKRNAFIPEVGQNEVEGYYAKFAFPYTMGEEQSGVVRLHITQKRGMGVGFDHELYAGRQNGMLSVFYEPSEGALSSHLSHTYHLSEALTSTIGANLQRNSGYFGSSENVSSDLSLRRQTADSNSELGYQWSMSKSGPISSKYTTTALSHSARPSMNTSWSLHATLRRTNYQPNQPTDEELETNFEFSRTGGSLSWRVAADKRYDLDASRYTGDSSYRAVNRTPEITLSTDSERMKMWGPLRKVYTHAELALGHFEQAPDNLRVNRAAFKFDLGGRERRGPGGRSMRTGARYYQSFYDDGSAQYLLGFTTDIRQPLGNYWTHRLQFDYVTPSGFAPIRLDYWGRRRDLNFGFAGNYPNGTRIDLSTGYDFILDAWRTAYGTFQVPTSGSSRLSVQAAYDLDGGQWRPLNARWAFVHEDALLFDISTQYDLKAGKMWQSALELDWRVDRKTRIEFLGRYSGFTHRLDQMNLRLTRDLHCWMGAISYDKLTGEFQVNLYLKAFPAIQANFGSSRGPRFDTGGGGVYY